MPSRIGWLLAVLLVAVACATPPAPELTGPSPGRSFIWVKRGTGPFTDDEIRSMAASYAYVVMDRTHDGASITGQLQEVRRLKAANPAVRVLVYVNAAYWFDSNDTPGGWGTRYDRRWSITDPSTGRPLRFRGITDSGIADFVDLGNPAYRTYLLGLIRGWAQQAPLDGIAFDSVRPVLPDRGVPDHQGLTWAAVLPPARITRYDDGLEALLRDTRRVLGPGRDVLFNGIAPSPLTTNRNLAHVDDADMTVDEDFCLETSSRTDVPTLREDLRLMATLAATGVRALEKTNTREITDPAELARLGRFCSAAFLLGWQPGSSYFKFGPDYGAGELTSDPPLARVRLGDPVGAHTEDPDGVARRDFASGTVIVNLSGRRQQIPARVDGTALGAGPAVPVRVTDPLDVGAYDAVVVLGAAGPTRWLIRTSGRPGRG